MPSALSQGLHVCIRLVEVSQPFNANQTIELRFDLEECHGIQGGELILRVAPQARALYYVGDVFSMNIRLV